MRATHSLLLASTILSVAGAATNLNASAAPLQGDVLAQANPANQPEKRNQQGEKKAPGHPTAPKPPSQPPQPHQAQPPRANQPPAPQHRIEEHAPANPAKREAPPPVPNKPRANERPQSNAPARQQLPQATVPGERGGQRPGVPPAAHQNTPTAPAGRAQPQPSPSLVQRAAPGANPSAVPPPTRAISKQQFLAPKGQAPTAGINQLRAQRHEVREGNRLFIREPDRTIIQEGNRTIISHNEVDRFAVDARDVHVERRGNETVTIVVRPDGVQIISISDDEGHLIRRLRRNPDGREIVIIDNGFAGPQPDMMFVDVPPPVIRIPRDRYILDADAANEALIYDVLVAPPVERLDRRYTLDQVRYNEFLRARMPRVDLDINFDTGSWQLTPDQVDRLAMIAAALNRAIQRNPREVFLIEGHTDAVGSDIDNLSLSDRRAESVAVAMTEQFQVPAENLVTQGYGAQDLKIQTNGPERANRRVAIRRITPLIDR